jgi:formylglycine-generating enzyme required for sulfatase activity
LIVRSKTACIGRKLVLMSKGTFMMGEPQSEKGRQEQETQHEVTNAFDDGCHFNLLLD